MKRKVLSLITALSIIMSVFGSFASINVFADETGCIWDFTKYEENPVTADAAQTEDYGGMEIHLASGDGISSDGVYWSVPSTINSAKVTNNRYIKYVAQKSGNLKITFKGSAVDGMKRYPRIYVSCGQTADCMTKSGSDAQLEGNQMLEIKKADTFDTLTAEVTEGNTYWIWSYYNNQTSCAFTVSQLEFDDFEAEMTTRNIYGSNMLLQRDKSVYIDGKCSRGVTAAEVKLIDEESGNAVQTKDAVIEDKEWNVTLDAVSDYTKTYKLTISAEGMADIVYTNILFGDLYLFSGQSNMWKQVSYYKNIDKDAYGEAAVAANATDKIRVMHTAGSGDYGTNVLQYDAQGAQGWRDFSTYENVSDIAAPAYTAVVKLYKETGVPIGCITNAYPGSYISSWFDSALAIDNCNLGKNGNMNERNWYCGRIYPLRNLKLSGIFWYQGCADAATTYHDNPYEYYSEMMPRLIDTWRELFGDDELPFYFTQLSRIGSTIVDENNPDTGAAGKMPIKLAQMDTYLNMENNANTGIVSTLDLYGNHTANATASCRNDIHLGQKNIVGERMAAYALKDIYKKNTYSDGSALYAHGPIYKSSKSENGRVIVSFDCSGQLTLMPSSQYTDTEGESKIEKGEINPEILNEFEIAGEDGVWYTASAEITADNQITLSSAEVTKPVKVRYCGSDYPESPNLTDASGMPSYAFSRNIDEASQFIDLEYEPIKLLYNSEDKLLRLISDDDDLEQATFIKASYNDNGTLKSAVSQTIPFNNGQAGIDNFEYTDSDKLFLWDSLENMKPLTVKKKLSDEPEETTGPTDEPKETTSPTDAPGGDEPQHTPEITATYKFDFGSNGNDAADGYMAVTPDMVYDMSKTDAQEGVYFGFLGTTDESYANDVLQYDCDKRAIDGFTLVKGQKIQLAGGGEASESDADSDYIAVPSKDNYIPATASDYEGRFPIRFSMKADRQSYYTVTAVLENSSAEEDACVSLFSEKRQLIAENAVIKPGEKLTFKFSVDIEDKAYKNFSQDFSDDMLNICVSGKNAAISSLVVEKHAKIDGKIKGADSKVNDGTTMWLCTDSTGCDYGAKVPFFALQSYGGVGQALSKYAPENIAISNQGEGGLSTGSKTHFNNCLLKEGDYLYVQYGHNEKGTDLYKTNLEDYYKRACDSGANLIIVSPINRHNADVYKDGTWVTGFGGYIEAGREFVNSKIDEGADNIAFVDMNTLYVDWMNRETDRIVMLNPQIARQTAMNFYYFSEKGTTVDNAHINDAGADQGAYYFFQAAENIVEAAKVEGADEYTVKQAKVLKPLVTGMKTTVGDSDAENLPMEVSEEIIKAGVAPNVYWDTVPSEFFNYDNAIAVDSVGAETKQDGSMEISSVGIRVMNPITYAKAVMTVSNNGEETKYYTENNYDCTGVESGSVLVNSGFITSDKNHDEVSSDDKISVITVPAGAKCTVQIFECDEFWVVGDNQALSTSYTVYPEINTIFNENGGSTDGWKTLTGVSRHTEEIIEDTDGSNYFSVYSSGVDNSNGKKNYGFYKELDESITNGVYRVSFKTRFGAGTVRFALVSTVNNASTPFANKIYPLIISSGKVTMNSDANPIYTLTETDGGAVTTSLNKVNANQWLNVDCIADLNEGKLKISVGGSDYTEFDIADWQTNSPLTLPIRYFGIAGSGDGTPTTADVKDMKITRVSEGDVSKQTINVNINEAGMGKVYINGTEGSCAQVDKASAPILKAEAVSGYKFVNWTDTDGNELSVADTYQIPRLFTDMELNANFAALASGEKIWDFAAYKDEGVTVTEAQNVNYDGLIMYMNNGDSITGNGLYWAANGTKGESDTASNNRYIIFTPTQDGEINLYFTGSPYDNSRKPRMYIVQSDSLNDAYKSNPAAKCAEQSGDGKTAVLTQTLEKDKTYIIWSYCYNKADRSFTVSNVTFTPADAQ